MMTQGSSTYKPPTWTRILLLGLVAVMIVGAFLKITFIVIIGIIGIAISGIGVYIDKSAQGKKAQAALPSKLEVHKVQDVQFHYKSPLWLMFPFLFFFCVVFNDLIFGMDPLSFTVGIIGCGIVGLGFWADYVAKKRRFLAPVPQKSVEVETDLLD